MFLRHAPQRLRTTAVSRRSLHQLHTLDRRRINPQDGQLTLSSVEPTQVAGPSSVPVQLSFDQKAPLFPPSIQGHFYYHADPTLPTPATGIRFLLHRQKEDLRDVHDMPWSIPVYRIALSASLSPLEDLLVADGLVGREVFDRIRTVYPAEWGEKEPFFVVHSLGQTIAVPPHRKVYGMWIAGKDKVLPLKFHTTFLGEGPFQPRNRWYNGSAHVSLDFDAARATFFTRILKAPDTVPQPLGVSSDANAPGRWVGGKHTFSDRRWVVGALNQRAPNRDVPIIPGKEDDFVVENWRGAHAMEALTLLLEGTEHMSSIL